MTREFKCRAWDSVKEEYIYSEQITGGMWRFFKTLEDRGIRHFESEFAVGLKDKNGKEIYERDIVKGIYVGLSKSSKPTTHIYQIIFLLGSFDINDPSCCDCCKSECACHGSLHEFLCCCDSVEVIGNIHENPELLND